MPGLKLSRPNPRAVLAFVHDVAAAALAWCVAFWLRFNLEIPPEYQQAMLVCLPYVVLIHALVYWLLGLYRGLWRYASLPDLQRILLAVGIAAMGVPAFLVLLGKAALVPKSWPV
jgi:FlaA1/EpsC-like NDP-sugar epimerase